MGLPRLRNADLLAILMFVIAVCYMILHRKVCCDASNEFNSGDAGSSETSCGDSKLEGWANLIMLWGSYVLVASFMTSGLASCLYPNKFSAHGRRRAHAGGRLAL